MSDSTAASPDIPPFRYNEVLARQIELKWQERWRADGTFHTPNPTGDLSHGFAEVADRPKFFVMDMFPYPSGTGLHVGHPLGFIGTDIYARFQRMRGYNVLHTMGFDAFGLPAEQHAINTGQHPRTNTENNVANYRRQLSRLGLGHDDRRSVSTTDVEFYRWTQWIFLQIFNSWFDPEVGRARPISELIALLDSGERTLDDERSWAELTNADKQRALLDYRLAYVAEAPVNWCPALGTVLANEEVTSDGRSERGNFPVYRRPMRQWMMRITAFADRLIDDLDELDWPEAIKSMQRNWIGRSTGARVHFEVEGVSNADIPVFTTRPDTLFGATYMVLAPEHPLVERLTTDSWPADSRDPWRGSEPSESPAAAVAAYRSSAGAKSDLERQVDVKEKTGVFTGSYAINPVNGARLPIFVADYVLMGYGTGAIMAVPAHDQRDFDFARKFDLPITAVVQPPASWYEERDLASGTAASDWPEAYTGDGVAIASQNDEISLDGKSVEDAKAVITEWLERRQKGEGSTTYRLRDWLFSRQRYWGEPFPIVWDENNNPVALPDSQLPLELPEIDDYAPQIVDADEERLPDPPLGRATDWKTVTLDLGDGPKQYRRELNTMPQWAGSCSYYLRYIDPSNAEAAADPVNERYWMAGNNERAHGGVDLYVGGVEHAVLHLLYSRFWHKVLFDLGHVSTPEPFQRLYNQGYVWADAFTDERGVYVEAKEVVNQDGVYLHNGTPVQRHTGKMGKSLKNSVTPDDIYESYGADSLRLYEMAMGPLDTGRPWTTTGITGVYRFLQRFWRNVVDESTGQLIVTEDEADPDTTKLLHRTIAGVTDDMAGLRFNTAISKLIELNNHLIKVGSVSRSTAETMVLMLAPLAPHVAEELWGKLGHDQSLTWEKFPEADPALLVDDVLDIPVQVQGKYRGKVSLPAGSPADVVEEAAKAEPNVARHLEGKQIRKVVVIPDKMVNIVVG